MVNAQLGAFEVSEDDIAILDSGQLVALLSKLLVAELWTNHLPANALQGTFKLSRPDGGEDFRVDWSDGPDHTDYLPKRFVIFQAKAEKLNVSDMKTIALTGKGRGAQLNIAVQEAAEKSGAYIVFTNKTNVTTPSRGRATRTTDGKSAVAKSAAKKALPRTKQTQLVETLKASIATHVKKANLTVDVLGPPRIRDWVNKFPAVALWLRKLIGAVAGNFAFQSGDDWSNYHDLRSTRFVASEESSAHILAITQTLEKPRTVLRVLGHSGLGKSRLAFEALRSSQGDVFSPLVIYARHYDIDLARQVQSLVAARRRAVVIVDDCSPDGHRRLSDEVRRVDSQLSLLTLDFSLHEPDSEDYMIQLTEARSDVIKGILVELSAAAGDDLKRATEFCAGYPQIAVLVGKALRDGAQHFADFRDSEHVIRKLVWGRDSEEPDQWRALRTASVFSAIGIRHPKDDQLEWIAKELLSITSDEFLFRLSKFKKRRVVQERGYSLHVVPRPVAARIAAEFWAELSPRQRTAINSGSMPGELKRALCERLADLDYVENARQVAAQLCGADGPFGTAEALNTELGARCLRELVQIAPEDVLGAIERCFGAWSADEIQAQLGPGRRSIIWTLEALLWGHKTFDGAVRMMLRLAVGENETWDNNATKEFAQCFRIGLPGTDASLEERASVLEALLDEADLAEARIILKAIGLMLDSRFSSRMLGSEKQGTKKTYVDYYPKAWPEIEEYVKRGLAMLRQIAAQDPALLAEARTTLEGATTGLLVGPSILADFDETISALNPSNETWSGLIGRLSRILRYELKEDHEADIRRSVRQLFDRLFPKTLAERILFYVKNLDWGYDDPDSTERTSFEMAPARAAALGAECASDRQTFASVVTDLSTGESKQALAFGRGLIEQASNTEAYVTVATDALIAAHPRGNPSLLAGFVSGLSKGSSTKGQQIVEFASAREELRAYVPFLASMHLTTDLLTLMTKMVREKHLKPRELSTLAAGSVLDPLPETAIVQLLTALQEDSTEGAWIALDLLGMYTFQNDVRLEAVLQTAEELLRTPGMLADSQQGTMDAHHYEQLAYKVMADIKLGPAFASYLTDAILKEREERDYHVDQLRGKLTKYLIENFADLFVPKLALRIETGSRRDGWLLDNLVSSEFSFEDEKPEGPLFQLPNGMLRKMCHQFPNNFAPYVARVAPLFAKDGDGRKVWTKTARMILEEFGKREDVLDSLTTNLHTGGWSGPTSTYLTSFVSPLEELRKHRHLSVKRWAKRQLDGFRERLAKEILDEEEDDLRRA